MAERVYQAKEQTMLSTKSASAASEPEPSEQKIQNPDDIGETIQFIHFTRNKSGYLE